VLALVTSTVPRPAPPQWRFKRPPCDADEKEYYPLCQQDAMCFMEPQKEGRCISQNWTLYFAKLNFRNRFSKGRKELLPPWVKWGNKDGQELIETGDQILAYFITACGLQPNAHVLDIGCGIGRMAVALTHYLTNEGGYDGIDIIPGVIKWCTRKITRQYPRFCFHFADVYNKDYNTRGRVKASWFLYLRTCSLKIWNTISLRLRKC
jgi:SAM-dependent methyltransferase